MATKTKPAARKSARAWRWKNGSRFRVKAAVAGRELERIRRSNAGSLTPATVVDAAADPDSPLHAAFEWDDTVAARRHREQQARQLLNSICCVVERGDPDAVQRIAFISVTHAETGRMYLPASAVMSDDVYRDQALKEAVAGLRGWQRRHKHLTELAGVFAAIDAALPKLAVKRKAA